MKICICVGRYDILHSGHFNMLTYARATIGVDGMVIVALDSDKRIRKADPMLPIIPQDIRRENLRVLKFGSKQTPMVDKIVIFETNYQLESLVASYKADFILKGSDWEHKRIIGSEHAPVKFYKADVNGVGEKISSSNIIKMVLEKYKKEVNE